jgi:hypothetical protein
MHAKSYVGQDFGELSRAAVLRPRSGDELRMSASGSTGWNGISYSAGRRC